jgi:hypothetical protein
MCGECNAVFHQYAIVFGLSPHVRGTANVVVVGDDAVRITPVCTGPLPAALIDAAAIPGVGDGRAMLRWLAALHDLI